MELANQYNHPPDLPALTLQDLHDYEHGLIALTADQLASAHYLRQTIMDSTVELAPAM